MMLYRKLRRGESIDNPRGWLANSGSRSVVFLLARVAHGKFAAQNVRYRRFSAARETNVRKRFAWIAGMAVLVTGTMFGQPAEGVAGPAQWSPVGNRAVKVAGDGPNQWKISSSEPGEFAVESTVSLPAKPGQAIEVALRRRVDLNTRVAPELVCFDAQGRRIDNPNALPPEAGTTSWQTFSRVFPVLPGTATVRAQIRAEGRGDFLVADLVLRSVPPDAYRTGRLITQIHPFRRRGLVLESDHGIVNRGLLSTGDVDGDGKWAIVAVDLDRLSAPEEKGEDWRTSFRYRPSEIYWSQGIVLKSDSILEDRPPSFEKALHFRLRGASRSISRHPQRPRPRRRCFRGWQDVEALRGWQRRPSWECSKRRTRRSNYGWTPATGIHHRRSGLLRLCPAVPDRTRPPWTGSSKRRAGRRSIRHAARWTANAWRSPWSPAFEGGANWPVRAGLPIPQGELADAQKATVTDATGRQLPSQNRAFATWPDGSVKWLYLDFMHDFS